MKDFCKWTIPVFALLRAVNPPVPVLSIYFKEIIMRSSLIFTLTFFLILGLSQQAKAYNPEACAKNPMTTIPQVINLLQPIDQKMLNCIPNLDTVANQWRSTAHRLKSNINTVRIGNEGNTVLEKLEYNVLGKYISLRIKVQVKHTGKVTVPAVKAHVPVTKYREVEACISRVRGVCIGVEYDKVPYTEMELRTITPEKTVSQSASATCIYDYTFNLLTFEQKPVFNCGQGNLGNYKFDATAIAQILNGEMPTLGSLLSSIDFTPPLFKDGNRDDYQKIKNDMISRHAGSIVYFSSESFVNWASAKNQTANVITSIITVGSYSPEFVRQMTEKLKAELTYMTAFATQTAINLGIEQIIAMMRGQETLKLTGYAISVKVVNVPEIIQKCFAYSRDCSPGLESPRLGFAIIATPIQQQQNNVRRQQGTASQGTVGQGTASQGAVGQGTASQGTIGQSTASQETASQAREREHAIQAAARQRAADQAVALNALDAQLQQQHAWTQTQIEEARAKEEAAAPRSMSAFRMARAEIERNEDREIRATLRKYLKQTENLDAVVADLQAGRKPQYLREIEQTVQRLQAGQTPPVPPGLHLLTTTNRDNIVQHLHQTYPVVILGPQLNQSEQKKFAMRVAASAGSGQSEPVRTHISEILTQTQTTLLQTGRPELQSFARQLTEMTLVNLFHTLFTDQKPSVVQVGPQVALTANVATVEHKKEMYWLEPRLQDGHVRMIEQSARLQLTPTFQLYLGITGVPR